MTTIVNVNSAICAFKHKITGTMEGDKIVVDIESPCVKIQKMSHMEIPMTETMMIKDNYAMQKAQENHCTPTCLVPAGVMHVCWMEMGMLSKSLAKKIGSVSINFDEVEL
ncbi:hypothetical protein V7O66_04605 [Methanolobus sp. ZRKC3]|uniref:DUF6951 family protein n=1 Tax=Methanolobus sp. ZRKC3 TaxID=3125786 RepID=UPI003248871A